MSTLLPHQQHVNPTACAARVPDRTERFYLALRWEAYYGARDGCRFCGERLGHKFECGRAPTELYEMEVREGVYAVRRITFADRIRAVTG